MPKITLTVEAHLKIATQLLATMLNSPIYEQTDEDTLCLRPTKLAELLATHVQVAHKYQIPRPTDETPPHDPQNHLARLLRRQLEGRDRRATKTTKPDSPTSTATKNAKDSKPPQTTAPHQDN